MNTALLALLGASVATATVTAEEKKPVNSIDEVAVIKTSEGDMVVRFWNDAAPETIANFKKLAPDSTTAQRFIASSRIS